MIMSPVINSLMSVEPKNLTDLDYASMMLGKMHEHRLYLRTTDGTLFDLDAIDDG